MKLSPNSHRMNKNSNIIEGKPAWISAEKWYEFLMELQLDMLDCRKNNDIMGMLETFDDLYIHVSPYIEKFIDESIENKLKTDDVEKLLDKKKKGDSDYIKRFNNGVLFNVKRLINEKRKILSKLMAKAEINIPLSKIQEKRPATHAGDEW